MEVMQPIFTLWQIIGSVVANQNNKLYSLITKLNVRRLKVKTKLYLCFDFQPSAVQFCHLTNTTGMSHRKVYSLSCLDTFSTVLRNHHQF